MPTSATELQLTPTARLARNLARQEALKRTVAGETAWLGTPILTFNAWLTRLQDDYLLLGDDQRVPIRADQARVLWQDLIEHDVFIGEPEVAGLAQQAWRTIHEYRLQPPAQWPELLLSEDSRRFRDWSNAYQQACRAQGVMDEWMFAAMIPNLIANGELEVPCSIELCGFDLPMTPLQQAVIEAAAQAGSELTWHRGVQFAGDDPEVYACAKADDELRAAALWAARQSTKI